MDDSIMTVEEAAAYLKLTVEGLRRIIIRGDIPATKIGGHWRIKKSIIDEMFQPEGDLNHE